MTTGGLTTQPEPWHKGSRRDSSADGITEYLRRNSRRWSATGAISRAVEVTDTETVAR